MPAARIAKLANVAAAPDKRFDPDFDPGLEAGAIGRATPSRGMEGLKDGTPL
jgi:hypothetical protein